MKLVAIAPEGRVRTMTAPARRRTVSAAAVARRRWLVGAAKRILPALATILLAAIILWPELGRDLRRAGSALRQGMPEPQSGEVTKARYNGVDDAGRPYTITADKARQINDQRIDLTAPIGDVLMQGGTWLYGRGRQGVYMQDSGQLDLSGDVTIYRDDGVTLQSDTATMDLHAGSASSADMVHAEGPFGTLDAQGFALLDRGDVIQFRGPGRLVLNGHNP